MARTLKVVRASRSERYLKGQTILGMTSAVTKVEVMSEGFRRVTGANGETKLLTENQLKRMLVSKISVNQAHVAVNTIKQIGPQKVEVTVGGKKKGVKKFVRNRGEAMRLISNYYATVPKVAADSPFRKV